MQIILCTLSTAGVGTLSGLMTSPGANSQAQAPLQSGSLHSGGSAGRRGGWFDCVVIDEAAQCIEPSALIPLCMLPHRPDRLVLVGDPKQLPATVISPAAEGSGMARSLFERLQTQGHAVQMLDTQYVFFACLRFYCDG